MSRLSEAMLLPETLAAQAKLALSLIDLTSLNPDDSEAVIRALAQSATTAHGRVAALCVYPRFVRVARETLPDIRIATVSNFPSGRADPAEAARSTREGLDAGADEIDTVWPYRAFVEGNESICRDTLRAVRDICGPETVLKVILETGELKHPELIRRAADLALEEGADFLKTSTGKVPVSATPEAVRTLMEALADGPKGRGLKIAGGVRNFADVAMYLKLVTETMGADFLQPETFRFGASGLLGALVAKLDGESAQTQDSGY